MAAVGGCGDVIVVLRDPLLRKPVWRRIRSRRKRMVFGFAEGKDVMAVIPWGKLGLYYHEECGEICITGCARDKSFEQFQRGSKKPRRSSWDKSAPKFCIVREEPGKWHVSECSPELLVKHVRASGPYSICCTTSRCGSTCSLGHGDLFVVEWEAGDFDHPVQNLSFQFYFADRVNQDEERDDKFSMLPTEVLSMIFNRLPKKEFLRSFGLVYPLRSSGWRMPWDDLDVEYNLDFYRLSEAADPVTLKTLRCTSANVGPSGGPRADSFSEVISNLMKSPQLTSLVIGGRTAYLVPCPAMPALRNLTLRSWSNPEVCTLLGALESSPVQSLTIEGNFSPREKFVHLFPRVKKVETNVHLDYGWACVEPFLSSKIHHVTHVGLKELTPAYLDQFGLLEMPHLNSLSLHGGPQLFPALVSYFSRRVFTGLTTLSVLLDGNAFPVNMDEFWRSLAHVAPMLKNLRLGGDSLMESDQLAVPHEMFLNLEVLVVDPALVEPGVVSSLLRGALPQLEYMKVATNMECWLPALQRLRVMYEGNTRWVRLVPGKLLGESGPRLQVAFWSSRQRHEVLVSEDVFKMESVGSS